MKSFIVSLFILILIILTSLVKNSTRELEAKIFKGEEQINILSDKKELILLENSYLSSPERLFKLKETLPIVNLIQLKLKKFVHLNSYEK